MKQHNYIHLIRTGDDTDTWTLIFHGGSGKATFTTPATATFEMLMVAHGYFKESMASWGTLVSNGTFNNDEFSGLARGEEVMRNYLNKKFKTKFDLSHL